MLFFGNKKKEKEKKKEKALFGLSDWILFWQNQDWLEWMDFDF